LLGGSPAGRADLVRVDRVEPLLARSRREDVRAPLDHAAVRAEGRLAADEEALELDVDAELLARLALHTALELLVRPHAAAGRPPDALRVRRLLDQRQPPARVEDEEGHVVPPLGGAAGEPELLLADVALPAQRPRLPVALPQGREHGFGQMHGSMVRSPA